MTRRRLPRRPDAPRLLVATAAALVAGVVMVGLGGFAAHTADDLACGAPSGDTLGITPHAAA
jgi:hypothetical protein